MDATGISKIGQAALYYAGMGWRVIPLTENSKFPPKIKEWQHEATIDSTVIIQWWSKWPNANIGIATGEKSGIFVLDVDGPKHGTNEAKGIDGNESLMELLEDHGGLIPDTVEAMTPTGGRHIIFKYPQGTAVPNSSNSLGDGLDVKSTNGYIVAAPSIVPAGEYIWECSSRPDEVAVAECPAWLLSAIITEKPINTVDRPHSFERRPTDGPAIHMLQNCAFMQHVQLNFKKLSYNEKLAAVTNIVRAVDGAAEAHRILSQAENYSYKISDEKINECLSNMNPQNCEYIRTSVGFKGCPSGGCDIAAPCGWSLGTVPQAKAKIRTIITPTPENVNNPEILGALALLQKKEPLVFDDFLQRYNGNKAALKKELSKSKIESSGLSVIEGGKAEEYPAMDSNGCRWLSQTVPDVPINLMLPGNPSQYSSWAFNHDGVAMKRVNDQGDVKYIKATYAPIIINERISNIDTIQEKASLSFKTHRGTWRNVILPKSTIFDAKKIMCLADSGLVVTSDTAKILTKWLSELEAANSQIIPDRVGVSKFGWRNNDTEFICPGMSNNYVLDTDDIAPQSVIDGYSIAGDHGSWLQAMIELRKNPKARFILAASFAAPLLKITGQRIFGIHNWGDSRDGKSAAQYAALSVWGKPNTIKILASSSETGIERMSALCSDLPLCISELETLDEHRRAEFENKTIYMITEGRGKQRGTIKGLQQSSSWRTIMITNAESPIVKDNSKGGIITRIIEINGGPFVNNQEFASYLYSVMENNYGHAGRIFLSHILTANHAEIRDIYNKLRFTLKQKYPEKIDSHIDAISHTALGDQLSSMYVFGEDKDTASRGALQTAEYIIENHLINNGDADESERAWQWMLGWIAANNGRFAINIKSAIPILGYIEDGYICILKTELAKAMKEQGFSPDKIFRKWADVGRIPITKNGEKRTFAVRGKKINGVKPWILKVKEESDLFG
jgi:putative DNA primase/helicase